MQNWIYFQTWIIDNLYHFSNQWQIYIQSQIFKQLKENDANSSHLPTFTGFSEKVVPILYTFSCL